MQKVTVHAGVLLSDAIALSSSRSPDVVLGERVLRMLISCPECHRIPLTRSVFIFGTKSKIRQTLSGRVVLWYGLATLCADSYLVPQQLGCNSACYRTLILSIQIHTLSPLLGYGVATLCTDSYLGQKQLGRKLQIL